VALCLEDVDKALEGAEARAFAACLATILRASLGMSRAPYAFRKTGPARRPAR